MLGMSDRHIHVAVWLSMYNGHSYCGSVYLICRVMSVVISVVTVLGRFSALDIGPCVDL